MTLSDEKIIDSVTDVEESYIEVYIRFNRDYEKDYCFQVKTNNSFKSLENIFLNLPIALRPNIFYNHVPKGYQVSVSPGYLTEDGGLLFDYEAEKNVKKVALSDKVGEHVWPGQLILPVWERNDFLLYSVITALIVWLYTDLPDFISPTPGICLTNQISKLLARIANYFGYGSLAKRLLDDIMEPVSLVTQIVFFTIHVIKCIIVFFVLWAGGFNPVSFNIPFISSPTKNIKDVTKEDLLALGWTGSRRAGPDEYKEFFRDYKIKQHGGLVQAHKAGVFEVLKHLGVFLGPGEGFNTPLDTKSTTKDLLKEDNENFTLNFDYYATVGECFESFCDKQDPAKLPELIKQFRRYGLLESNATIKKMVEIRKKGGDKMMK